MGYILHIPTKMAVSNPNRVDYIDNLAQTHGRFFFAQLKRAAFPQVELYIHNPAMLYSWYGTPPAHPVEQTSNHYANFCIRRFFCFC